jgi:hypothetical protein
MIYFPLTKFRLGPYKLACVLNKCLDRFEHPDENVQRHSGPDHIPTIDLTQSLSRSSLGEESPVLSRPSTLSPVSTSPPPAQMPPLLNQPYWHQTDKLEATSSPNSEFLDSSTPAPGPPAVGERAHSIRAKLTIPGTSVSATSNILIVDDNAINRRVSSLYSHIRTSTLS